MATSMNSLPSTTVASSPQNPNSDLAAADLPTTISILSSLVAFADTTLSSVSSLLSASTPLSNPTFSQCPFDSRHRMPPESIFIHSLRCPSAPASARIAPDFPEYFHYARSPTEVQKEDAFIRSPLDPEEELFFSIDREFANFGVGPGFFYRDCPGVVSFPEVDDSGRNFTLPGFLAVECANFSGGLDAEDVISIGEGGGIMPSELWELRREVCSWKYFPRSYSYVVPRVLSRLDELGNEALSKWMIANSPRYGILIDAPISDHIFLLLKLCLKAIWREGCRSMKFSFERRGSLDKQGTWATVDCPCLYRSMTWLASQLSILYGEVNGKLFVIDMIKESLIQTGTGSLLFPVDGDSSKVETLTQSRSNAIGMDGGCKPEVTGDGDGLKSPGSTCFRQVFVSQIAAAIAALHERFLIESRINKSNFIQTLPTYQRSSEHSYRSTRAIEERAKRPNYKPLLEHDGLLQQSCQQGQDKPKTREEMLAEERDYKRRRMSYRGKKEKRTPSQVLHDIIEEHMEEIRHAGGIGCNVNKVTDSYKVPYVKHSGASRLAEGNYKNNMSDMSCYSKRVPLKPQPESEGKYKIYIHGDERGTEYGSRSPRYCSRAKSSFSVESQKQGVQSSVNSNSHHSSRPRDEKRESYLPSPYENLSEHNASSRVTSHMSDRSKKYRRLESVMQNTFEDRYNPSGSYH